MCHAAAGLMPMPKEPQAGIGPRSSFKDLDGLSRDLGNGLLFDESTADITLRVQDEKLYAHRAILGSRSPVFKAMFYGSMKERSQDEVEVIPFMPTTMRLLLRFIYTGHAECVKLEEMVPLMACADHYGVTTLREAIASHLSDSVCPETACTVLALARTYQQDDVAEQYLSFIMTHAQQVTKTEGFLFLDKAVLLKILDADEVRIDEIDLFKALVRWYRHWSRDPEVQPEEMQADCLFGSIRYGQMTGQQLVNEVRPLVGKIVPRDLYVRALEQVAAPEMNAFDDHQRKQGVRRQPPIGSIQISDPQYLHVNSTVVRKIGPAGWNCTAVIEPSTQRTCFTVDRLVDNNNGVGIAIFDPDRNALRGTTAPAGVGLGIINNGAIGGFPNPNQWGADCIVGIYGTGCFFGIITDHVLRWHEGITVEVTMMTKNNQLQVTFSAEGLGGDKISAEGPLSVPQGVKLAVALYSPDDKVSIESVW